MFWRLLTLGLAAAAAMADSVYAPADAACPGSPLVRAATGLSPAEASYTAARKVNADAALAAWLAAALPGGLAAATAVGAALPSVALAVSGGGFRSLLTAAGVVQALDARDGGGAGTAGLFQALTYHAALSGGAWLLSALAAGNWPTVTALAADVWTPRLQAGILAPGSAAAAAALAQIGADIGAKGARGFPVSLTDAWGRMLGYQVMGGGGDGAAGTTLTAVAGLSNFTAQAVPFPILTAALIDPATGECAPGAAGPVFEFTPFEFGAWAGGVGAFVQARYLGSNITGGVAAQCATGFDTLAWAMGASSNLLPSFACDASLGVDVTRFFPAAIVAAVEQFTPAARYGYSIVPNPFQGFLSPAAATSSSSSSSSSAAAPPALAADQLFLVDGGEPDRNVPLLPLLEPGRGVDVVVVSDNSNDALAYPDGSALAAAYEAAQRDGRLRGRLPRMPAPGLFSTLKAQFFGCNDSAAVTVVYLPNAHWTFPSNVSTMQLQFSAAETAALIANGNQIATQGGDPEWPRCLACGLMLKVVGAHKLPHECHACLASYCWKG